MRIKHVLRYYCDFCGRGYFKKPSIERHENGCTANPSRICGLCQYAEPALEQKPMVDLVRCLSWDKDGYGMKELRQLCEGCPGCILAAIRQSGMLKQAVAEGEHVDFEFDFKKELADWRATANESKTSLCE